MTKKVEGVTRKCFNRTPKKEDGERESESGEGYGGVNRNSLISSFSCAQVREAMSLVSISGDGSLFAKTHASTRPTNTSARRSPAGFKLQQWLFRCTVLPERGARVAASSVQERNDTEKENVERLSKENAV